MINDDRFLLPSEVYERRYAEGALLGFEPVRARSLSEAYSLWCDRPTRLRRLDEFLAWSIVRYAGDGVPWHLVLGTLDSFRQQGGRTPSTRTTLCVHDDDRSGPLQIRRAVADDRVPKDYQDDFFSLRGPSSPDVDVDYMVHGARPPRARSGTGDPLYFDIRATGSHPTTREIETRFGITFHDRPGF